MHGDKRSEKSFLLPDSYTQRFTWIYFFYLWSNRIDLSLNSSRKSKGDLCEALLQISVYFWRWCVCVCENIIYGSLHGCNSKIHWVGKSKNIIPFSLSAAVEPGQNAQRNYLRILKRKQQPADGRRSIEFKIISDWQWVCYFFLPIFFRLDLTWLKSQKQALALQEKAPTKLLYFCEQLEWVLLTFGESVRNGSLSFFFFLLKLIFVSTTRLSHGIFVLGIFKSLYL